MPGLIRQLDPGEEVWTSGAVVVKNVGNGRVTLEFRATRDVVITHYDAENLPENLTDED